jgi:hypothetical protein
MYTARQARRTLTRSLFYVALRFLHLPWWLASGLARRFAR